MKDIMEQFGRKVFITVLTEVQRRGPHNELRSPFFETL